MYSGIKNLSEGLIAFIPCFITTA